MIPDTCSYCRPFLVSMWQVITSTCMDFIVIYLLTTPKSIVLAQIFLLMSILTYLTDYLRSPLRDLTVPWYSQQKTHDASSPTPSLPKLIFPQGSESQYIVSHTTRYSCLKPRINLRPHPLSHHLHPKN